MSVLNTKQLRVMVVQQSAKVEENDPMRLILMLGELACQFTGFLPDLQRDRLRSAGARRSKSQP